MILILCFEKKGQKTKERKTFQEKDGFFFTLGFYQITNNNNKKKSFEIMHE